MVNYKWGIDMDLYNVLIEKNDAKQKPFSIYAFDLEKSFLIEKIMKPYLIGDNFIVDGYTLNKSNVNRLKILKTNENINSLVSKAQHSLSTGILMVISKNDILSDYRYAIDVTQSIYDELQKSFDSIDKEKEKLANTSNSNYIFVVHGHNMNRVNEMESFIRSIDYEPIVLFKEADHGQTIIEKIETFANKACYAIILYTKCDYGYSVGDEKNKKYRARQSVVFEHGYLMKKLGRDRICVIVDGDDIEIPGDISGIIYLNMDNAGYLKFKLAQNMNSVGLKIDMNKIR